MTPFVSVQPTVLQQFKDLKKQLKNGNAELVTTAKYKTPAIKNSSYLGNLWNQNLRFRYNIPGLYSFGITADKDPGEAYWRKGPDFVSMHASIQNIGIIKMAVAGDYCCFHYFWKQAAATCPQSGFEFQRV